MRPDELSDAIMGRLDGAIAEVLPELGAAQIANIHRRASRGVGANDQAMPKYTNAYAQRKARSGRNARVRDLTWTGRMLGSIAIVVEEGRVKVGISDSQSLIKAKAQQARSPWFGVSPSDRDLLTKLANEAIREALTK